MDNIHPKFLQLMLAAPCKDNPPSWFQPSGHLQRPEMDVTFCDFISRHSAKDILKKVNGDIMMLSSLEIDEWVEIKSVESLDEVHGARQNMLMPFFLDWYKGYQRHLEDCRKYDVAMLNRDKDRMLKWPVFYATEVVKEAVKFADGNAVIPDEKELPF